MTTFNIIQTAVDLALLGGFGVWLWDRREARKWNSDEKISAALAGIDLKIQELEQEAYQYKVRMEEHIKNLLRVCEEAQQLVDQAKLRVIAFSPSREEYELKCAATGEREAVADAQVNEDRIPTLAELEKTRERLQGGIGMDLRTVLRDQLA